MSMPAEFTDPRRVTAEVLGFDPAVIADELLPCGQLACTPLGGECVERGTDPRQAVISCARYMGYRALSNRLSSIEDERSAHVELIRRLSTDPNTGILTRGAQEVLFEDMNTMGLLEKMRQQGYIFQFLLSDMDKLKLHNDLGGHQGGDIALAIAAEKMNSLYSRNYDLVTRKGISGGVLEHRENAERAVSDSGQFDVASRFDRGDELFVMSFVPPPSLPPPGKKMRLPAEMTADIQVGRVIKAFEGLRAQYPVSAGLTTDIVNRIRADNPSFEFRINDGIVDAPVSISFVLAVDRVPVARNEFAALQRAADQVLNVIKQRRADIRTRGQALNFLQR